MLQEQPAVLSSWKDIAKYTGKGVRTVQRWERDLGLPVRRPTGGTARKSMVMLYRAEMDAWMETRFSLRARPVQEVFPALDSCDKARGSLHQGIRSAREFARETRTQHEAEDLATDGVVSQLAGTGLEVIDLQSDVAFARRHLHVRDVVSQIECMNGLARVFEESPTKILQELVNAAVDLCGADSAGISVEQKDAPDENFWFWVATAGQYSGFVDAKLPRYPSACGVTIERGRPQIFRVTKRFFDLMGVQAPTVTDGMLLPWQTEETRGTIWIMAHGRTEAFDVEDCRIMQALANFAATGVRLQQQQKLLTEQARTAATAAMANDLAHQINNPLQELMQMVFLFGRGGADSVVFAQQAMGSVVRLSDVVKRLLADATAGLTSEHRPTQKRSSPPRGGRKSRQLISLNGN
jgi:hypothetical protein